MGHWSGLGSAYNGHMRQFMLAKRDSDHLAKMFDGGRPIQVRGDTHPVLIRWLSFAKSWGTPEGDLVQPGLRVLDESFSEESNMTGRAQFEYDPGIRGTTAMKLLETETKMLSDAVTHYISGNIVRKIEAAAELAEPEPIFDTDLTSMTGFAVLEWPILLMDFHPDTGVLDPRITMPVRAIGWSVVDGILHGQSDNRTVGRGLMLYLYTTPDDYVDYYAASLKSVGIYGSVVPEKVKRDDFIIIDVLPWAFGTPWSGRDSVDHQDTTVPAPVAFVRRWFLSLMRFTWQTLLVPSSERPTKKVSSRWDVLARQRPHNDCTVMRLRRAVNPDRYEVGGGGGVPLEHQVKVRGHWRRQWFGSLGPAYGDGGEWNPESHRLVWIDEHWRGPEDAPIGAMRHASVVTR